MPFQAVPDSVHITLEGELLGEKVNNTLGFKLITPAIVTAAALETILEGVVDRWVTGIMPMLADDYIFRKGTGRVLDVEDGPVAENSTGSGTPGGLLGAPLPNNVSFTVSFKTGLGGRTNRGRNYVAGLTEPLVTANSVDSGWAEDIRSAYDGNFMGAGAVRAGWIWCVISRKIIIPMVTGRGVPITQVVVNDLVIDSQRRRLPGRGA